MEVLGNTERYLSRSPMQMRKIWLHGLLHGMRTIKHYRIGGISVDELETFIMDNPVINIYRDGYV